MWIVILIRVVILRVRIVLNKSEILVVHYVGVMFIVFINYISHKYNDKTALGFAVGTNYGMETDLGKDFGGVFVGLL